MNRVKRSIVANLIGKGWTALLSFALVPLYLRYLGMEAYGLVGFYATLQAVFFLIDMGLSVSLNREIARLSVYEGKAQEMRDLVRTIEALYWLLALVIALLVNLIAPIIAQN